MINYLKVIAVSFDYLPAHVWGSWKQNKADLRWKRHLKAWPQQEWPSEINLACLFIIDGLVTGLVSEMLGWLAELAFTPYLPFSLFCLQDEAMLTLPYVWQLDLHAGILFVLGAVLSIICDYSPIRTGLVLPGVLS